MEPLSSDADHVTATLLAFHEEEPVVYIAKNAGLDPARPARSAARGTKADTADTEDTENCEEIVFMEKLQQWLRSTSLDRERRSPENDSMLLDLINFNKVRLEYYITELNALRSLAKRESSPRGPCSIESTARAKLLKLYAAYSPESAEGPTLPEIVSCAYGIRYTKRSPSGLRAMLDYLAITECDDGAIRDVQFSQNQDDPDMVTVSYLQKISQLEKMGWEGFSSDQL